MFEDYLNKLTVIAQVKYDIEPVVLESFMFEIEQCYKQNFTPRRTVEVVACHLFD